MNTRRSPASSAAARLVRGALWSAAELLWPSCCAGCDVAVKPGRYLCAACNGAPARLQPPFCSVCSRSFAEDGAPVRPEGAGLCSECAVSHFAFECAVNFCHHDGVARELVMRFKYGGEHFLRRPLGRWLAESLGTDARLLTRRPVDALVPVPLHRRRERERGYNQADALCRGLARETGLPVWRALRRARHTQSQARLTREERLTNLRGAFAPVPRVPVTGARLLLVDDVFTTGSTVHECARVLREAGAANVRVLTVTRR